MTDDPTQDAPLSGLLVADFSRVLAGPLATVMLADLGADVIKVERPAVGDDTRGWGPPWTDNSASYFHAANRTKRSVELDLTKEPDRALAAELARRADVLVENFRHGWMREHGLGYDDVRVANPRVIYLSITGFGSEGGATLPGYDFLVQAVGGLMSITGPPGGPPTKAGVALVDVLTSKDAVIGVLAALAARERTGEGQQVEVNLLSSLLGSLVNQASSYLATGADPVAMGNRHPSIAPYETLRAEDGHLAVCVGNDRQFERLVTVLGRPELAADERFVTNGDRVAHRSELLEALETALASKTVAEWANRLNAAGVPAGKINTIGEAIALAEELGLRPTGKVSGAHRQVANPIGFSASRIVPPVAPPRLGEHNDDIRRWLGDGKTPGAESG